MRIYLNVGDWQVCGKILGACNIMYVILKGCGLGLMMGKAWRLDRARNGRSGLNLRGLSGREA